MEVRGQLCDFSKELFQSEGTAKAAALGRRHVLGVFLEAQGEGRGCEGRGTGEVSSMRDGKLGRVLSRGATCGSCMESRF